MANKIEICNIALDLIGHGGRLRSLSEVTPEAEACNLHYQSAYEYCIDFANWSFTTRDEVIDTSDLLNGVYVLPYKHAYRLPTDVLRVLYIVKLDAPSAAETERYKLPNHIQFSFRNYDGQKVLATDQEPSFIVQYQAYVDSSMSLPPIFTSALAYLLASRLAPSLIKSTEGFAIGTKFYQLALAELQRASEIDLQQSTYSLDYHKPFPAAIRARR